MKRILKLGAAVIALLGVFACGSVATPSSSAGTGDSTLDGHVDVGWVTVDGRNGPAKIQRVTWSNGYPGGISCNWGNMRPAD